MIPYNLLFKTNEQLIKGNIFSETQKRETFDILLNAVNKESTTHTKINTTTSYMYPLFYTYPYNKDKNYRTITLVTPRTIIFSANSYELEILRILSLFDNENEKVNSMLQRTKERLLKTCFGNFCCKGECFETSIIALRFIGTVFPEETELMKSLIFGITSHFYDKKRHSGTVYYYFLALSELPLAIAVPEITKFKNHMLQQLQKSYILNSANDKYINTLIKYILRNCLEKLPEFKYLEGRKPFISEKDDRLYFNISPIN